MYYFEFAFETSEKPPAPWTQVNGMWMCNFIIDLI